LPFYSGPKGPLSVSKMVGGFAMFGVARQRVHMHQ
jgi:hypothetical protein